MVLSQALGCALVPVIPVVVKTLGERTAVVLASLAILLAAFSFITIVLGVTAVVLLVPACYVFIRYTLVAFPATEIFLCVNPRTSWSKAVIK